MHELILDLVRERPDRYRLVRLPFDDGAMVALFSGARRPRWIAKTATTAAGAERLRAEAWALGQMEKHADELGIPRLLGWRECDFPDGACLVISAVPGRPVLASNAWGLPVTVPMHVVEEWLQRFQQVTPPPKPMSLADVAAQARVQVEIDAAAHPEQASLLSGLTEGLRTVPVRVGSDAAATMVHGDFWAGNVLADGRGAIRLSVIDWSGFAVGSPIDDVMTWLAHTPARGDATARLDRWRKVFFSAGDERDRLRRWSLRVGYVPEAARLAFYLFLLRRMSWELGLRLQHRSTEEQTQARQEWTAVVAWLAHNQYPDPFLTDPD